MSNLDAAARRKLDPKWFAGPHRSFPIADCSDVQDAWNLSGKAANPSQVRSNILRLAKARGCAMPHSPKLKKGKGSDTTEHSARASFAEPDEELAVTSETYLMDPDLFRDEPPPGYRRRTGTIFKLGDYPT